MFFVSVLAVGELLCWMTDVYCFLNASAIFLGVVKYFPLNFIASLLLDFVLPPFNV